MSRANDVAGRSATLTPRRFETPAVRSLEDYYRTDPAPVPSRGLSLLPEDPRRHPVVRLGQRPEIPLHIRIAVYMRDGNVCCNCRTYVREVPKELDHIHPWSAGGSDRSTNLRLLCRRCNQARSNFVDGTPPAQPVTWWCTDCWGVDTRREAMWTNKLGEFGWRGRKPLIYPEQSALVLAYCAFDGRLGYTPWPL
jgi:5-methylcytosine-specific restriction endonuclease McrA